MVLDQQVNNMEETEAIRDIIFRCLRGTLPFTMYSETIFDFQISEEYFSISMCNSPEIGPIIKYGYTPFNDIRLNEEEYTEFSYLFEKLLKYKQEYNKKVLLINSKLP